MTTENQRTASPVDAYVGRRLKEARESLGYSQEKLADLLGISFQQVQKYERGFNRVSASRLLQISKALDKQTQYFFEGLEIETAAPANTGEIAGLLAAPNALALLREYNGLTKAKQTKVLELVKLMAA